jgi:hypothetical protein
VFQPVVIGVVCDVLLPVVGVLVDLTKDELVSNSHPVKSVVLVELDSVLYSGVEFVRYQFS